jgi:hypothetical protein
MVVWSHRSFVIQSTMKLAAQFISEFFSPLLVPLMAFMGLLSAHPWLEPTTRLLYFAIAAIFSSGLISAYVYYLKHKRVIESTELIVREQRISPLTFAVLSYSFGYLCLNAFKAPPLIQGLMFCYATNSLLLLLITKSWKISMHMAAIAGSIVALTYMYGNSMLPFYGLIPIVGMARITMQRQNIPQVVAGGLLGLITTSFQLKLFLQ